MIQGFTIAVIFFFSMFMITWVSPKALEYLIALMLARREAIRVHHTVKNWYLKRFETEL
jgi:hypothetical protein